MFLVSAMREDFVHSGDARQAVFRGFKASSRVVTAAALIMVSVFVALHPGRHGHHPADRVRPRRRCLRGRLRRTDDPGPGRDGAAGPVGLVAAPVDGPAGPGGRRGRRRTSPQDRVRAVGAGQRRGDPAGQGPRAARGRPAGAARGHRRSGKPADGARRRTMSATWATCWWGAGPSAERSWWTGLLLPEQREAVNRRATLIELTSRRPASAGRRRGPGPGTRRGPHAAGPSRLRRETRRDDERARTGPRPADRPPRQRQMTTSRP